MKKSLFFGVIVVLTVLAACKKTHPEPEDLSYMCECGELTWKGTTYPLVSAEFTSENDTTLDRAYYLSAPIGMDEDPYAHHLNVSFSLDDVLIQNFFPSGDSNLVVVDVEEVNRVNNLPEVRKYETALGVVTVSPGLTPGSNETLSFNLQMVAEDDSLPEPQILSLVGNMSVVR